MKLIDNTATTRKSFVIYTLQLKMYWMLFIMSLHLLIGVSGTYLSMPNQTADGNNTPEVYQAYNCTDSTGTINELGFEIDNLLSTYTVMWINAAGESSGWIHLLGCFYKPDRANYFYVNIGTAEHVMECNKICRKFDNQINYFGLQKNVCFCSINGLSNFNRSPKCLSKHYGDQLPNFCGSEDEIVLYNRDMGIDLRDHGRNYLIVSENCSVQQIGDFYCSSKLLYLCINKDDKNEGVVNASLSSVKCLEAAAWPEAVANCTTLNKTIISSNNKAESSCVAVTLSNRKLYTFVTNCKTSSATEDNIEGDGSYCSWKNCILHIYLISSVPVVVVLFVVFGCCLSWKQEKRKKKNPESYGSRWNGRTDQMCRIIPLNAQQIPPRSLRPDAELYSFAKPASRQPEIVDIVNPYSVPHTSGNSSRKAQWTFESNGKTRDAHKTYERNNSWEIDVKENEYNELNHTLRPAFDNGKANVYDKVKPKKLTLVKGETFIGSEYDSMDKLNAVKTQKGKT